LCLEEMPGDGGGAVPAGEPQATCNENPITQT
jgi:hypothetical protein